MLLIVGCLVAWFIAELAWLSLTMGAGETTPIVAGPVTLGPEWTLLVPARPIECSRPQRYIELTFPVRGQDASIISTIRRVRNANPEIVVEDIEGREYPYRLDGESYQHGVSHTVMGFLGTTPESFTLKSLRIRAAERLMIPQIVLSCHNDSL